MKFIFPKNYDFKSKLFGIIDYNTLFVNIIWNIFIFCFTGIFINSLNIRLFVFIIFSLPILLLSIVGFNHENIVYVIKYILKYCLSPKLYLFSKRIN